MSPEPEGDVGGFEPLPGYLLKRVLAGEITSGQARAELRDSGGSQQAFNDRIRAAAASDELPQEAATGMLGEIAGKPLEPEAIPDDRREANDAIRRAAGRRP